MWWKRSERGNGSPPLLPKTLTTMSEHVTKDENEAAAPENQQSVQTGVANILKFLDFDRESSSVVDVGYVLTTTLSAHSKNDEILDTAPRLGTGKVTKWFPGRGFGFIQADGSSEDLFAHMTEIEGKFNALVIGGTVSFTRAYNATRGKFQATKVSGEGCIRARMNTGRSRGICFDFQKGMCTRGSSCRFSHPRGGRGRRGRGRGYKNRGRGRFNNMNPPPYAYGGYGVPFGNGYGMGGYGGYPMMGFPAGGYGSSPYAYAYSGSGGYTGGPMPYGMYNPGDATSPKSSGADKDGFPNSSLDSPPHSFGAGYTQFSPPHPALPMYPGPGDGSGGMPHMRGNSEAPPSDTRSGSAANGLNQRPLGTGTEAMVRTNAAMAAGSSHDLSSSF